MTEPPPGLLRRMPNALTVARLLAVVPIAALVLVPGPWAAAGALALFAAASVTDWVDGWLARRLNAVSAFGRLIDPIADKVLVTAALLALAGDGRIDGIHVAAAILIAARELMVSGLREFLAVNQVGGLPVTQLAKWKTAVQMAGLAFLIGTPMLPDAAWPMTVGLAGLWVAAVLTLWTGLDYGAKALRAIRAGAAAPGARPG